MIEEEVSAIKIKWRGQSRLLRHLMCAIFLYSIKEESLSIPTRSCVQTEKNC